MKPSMQTTINAALPTPSVPPLPTGVWLGEINPRRADPEDIHCDRDSQGRPAGHEPALRPAVLLVPKKKE